MTSENSSWVVGYLIVIVLSYGLVSIMSN